MKTANVYKCDWCLLVIPHLPLWDRIDEKKETRHFCSAICKIHEEVYAKHVAALDKRDQEESPGGPRAA